MFGRRHCLLLATALFALAACAPANERPLRGAQPGSTIATPPGVPPTLVPSDALRQRQLPTVESIQAQPSPGLRPSVQPSPSVVAAPPIVRTIVPGANGHVPAGGPVTVSAVLVGRSADLASASLSVNGADARAQIDKRTPRDWTIHTSETLENGTHTVKVLVRDATGAAGGFTWQITVGEPEPRPEATPEAAST
jgi:Bacterial Ig domain